MAHRTLFLLATGLLANTLVLWGSSGGRALLLAAHAADGARGVARVFSSVDAWEAAISAQAPLAPERLAVLFATAVLAAYVVF